MSAVLNVEVLESESNTNSNSAYLPEMPYRGLEPFRYVDSPIFFARTKEVGKLLRYVTIYRGVLFYGESGTGKSSLINAGLIPELIEDGFTPDRIRVQPEKNKELIVERIPQTANGQPPYLPSNFAGDDDFQSTPSRIVLPVKDLKRSLENLPSDKLPLLIFDQFEEIITLFEDARVGKNLEESLELQDSILNVLVDLISDQTLTVKLLFVFREDYLAKLNKFLMRCPDLTDQFLRLIPPATETLDAIIRNPFKQFPGKFGNEFSDSLISRLETQLKEHSEASMLNLSEVQVVCLKLWQSNAPESVLEKRNVAGLLEDFLNESLKNLPKDLYEPSIALLRRMVTSSGTRNVVSEDDLIVSVKKEGFTEDKIKKSLEALTYQTRLVRHERRHDTSFYQIVSEFLVPWIRSKQMEQKARMTRRKLLRRTTILAGAALLVAFIGSLFAYAYYVSSVRTIEAMATEKVKQEAAKREEAEQQAKAANDENAVLKNKNSELTTLADKKTEELNIANARINQLQGDFKELNQKYYQLFKENGVISARSIELERYVTEANANRKRMFRLEELVDYWKKKADECEKK